MTKRSTPATMLEHALDYASAGLKVIPLHSVLEDGACTCGAPSGRCSPGKHPRIGDWRNEATTDPEVIAKWWSDRRWPNANIGGVCGDYMCLDIDARHDGFASLERLIKSNTSLPDTAVAETGEYDGERGKHYWYKVPAGHDPSTRANVRQGIDIRARGGYAVLPPSPHTSGVNYTWITGGIQDAVEAPEWICALVPEHITGDSTWAPDPNFRMSKAVKEFLNGNVEVPIGEQREFLTAAARSVLTTGRNVETASSLLWEGYDGSGGISNCDFNNDDPWTPEDIYAIVSDIFAKPPTTPLEKNFATDDFSFDDLGNAERLIASFPDDHVMYVWEVDRWYIWDANRKRYVIDPSGVWMRSRWGTIADEIGKLAMNARTEGEANALQRHARVSRMKPRVDAAITLARDFATVDESDLDFDPMMLGCANGVIDLRDGTLREQTPTDYITRRSPIMFNDKAKSSLFDSFLKRVVPDKDLRDFLQLAAGYSLTGSIEEHVFFYVYGRPASGKTTILEALKHIMGGYGITAETSTFMRQSGRSGPTDDIARLAGARFVVTHEVEKDERLAASLVSHMVGGESITARFMYTKPFEFFPRFKLWIGANHLPKVVGGARSGIWRRVKILSFDEPIPVAERDPTLAGKLREPEAAAAILAWAVEGATRWHANRANGQALTEPQIVTDAATEYQRESNHVMVFAEQVITTAEKHDRVSASEMFAAYRQWCQQEGRDHTLTKNALGRDLRELGHVAVQARHDGKSQRCYIGIRLRDVKSGSGINVKGATKRTKR